MLEVNEGDSCATPTNKKKNMSDRRSDLAASHRWDVLFIQRSLLPVFLALHQSTRPYWMIYTFLVILPTWVIVLHRDHNHPNTKNNSRATWKATTTTWTTLRLMGIFAILSVLTCGYSSVVATTTETPSFQLRSKTTQMMFDYWMPLALLVIVNVIVLQARMLLETFFVHGHFANPSIKAMARSTFLVSVCLCAISIKLLCLAAFSSFSSSTVTDASVLIRKIIIHNVNASEASAALDVLGVDITHHAVDITVRAGLAMTVPLIFFVTSCAVFVYASWILSRATAAASAAPATGIGCADVAGLVSISSIPFMYGLPLVLHAFPIYYGWFKVHYRLQEIVYITNKKMEFQSSGQLFLLSMTLFGLATMFHKLFLIPIHYRLVQLPNSDNESNNLISGGGGSTLVVATMSKTYVHDTKDIVGVFQLENQPTAPSLAVGETTSTATERQQQQNTSSDYLDYCSCKGVKAQRVVVEMKGGITLHLTPKNPTEFIDLIENAMEKEDNCDLEQQHRPSPTTTTTTTTEKETVPDELMHQRQVWSSSRRRNWFSKNSNGGMQ